MKHKRILNWHNWKNGRLTPAYCHFTAIVMFPIIVLALLAAMLLPSLSNAREEARKHVCMENLKTVGSAILAYAQDYKENFPGDLSELYPEYVTSRMTFICPGKLVNEKEISKNFNICYEYIQGMTKEHDSCLIVFDMEGNHRNGRNACFTNGETKWIPGDIWPAAWQEHNEKLELDKNRYTK